MQNAESAGNDKPRRSDSAGFLFALHSDQGIMRGMPMTDSTRRLLFYGVACPLVTLIFAGAYYPVVGLILLLGILVCSPIFALFSIWVRSLAESPDTERRIYANCL